METKVYEAASRNDISFVREALAGSHGEIPESDLELALLRAASNGHKQCVDLLLASNVSVFSRDGSEDTALILAAQRGHADIVETLIHRGCPVNYQNSLGYTALMKACEFGHLRVAEMLLANGADESSHSSRFDDEGEMGLSMESRLRRDLPHGYTPLMVTVLKQANGYQELMKLLVTAKVDVDEEDLEGCTVLHHAAKRCDSDALQILLDGNANVNYIDIWGVTPLMNACAYNMVDNVKLLLQYGADVSVVCKSRRSCLSIAARTACVEIISMLLAAGADPDHLDAHKKSPLFIAMCHQNYAAMKCLIQIGCDLGISCFEITSWQMLTYFANAIWRKDVEMVRMLHTAGACSNQTLYDYSRSEKYESHCSDKPEVIETLQELASTPRTLMSECRLAVRGAIKTSMPLNICRLSLPKTLKDYLLYPDIILEHPE